MFSFLVSRSHQGEIEELEHELAQVEKKIEAFEQESIETAARKGRDVSLEESQVKEYNRLKEKAGKMASAALQEYDSVAREQKTDQDHLDNELRKRNECEAKLKQKKAELEENQRRVNKLVDYIKTSENSLHDLK